MIKVEFSIEDSLELYNCGLITLEEMLDRKPSVSIKIDPEHPKFNAIMEILGNDARGIDTQNL